MESVDVSIKTDPKLTQSKKKGFWGDKRSENLQLTKLRKWNAALTIFRILQLYTLLHESFWRKRNFNFRLVYSISLFTELKINSGTDNQKRTSHIIIYIFFISTRLLISFLSIKLNRLFMRPTPDQILQSKNEKWVDCYCVFDVILVRVHRFVSTL